MEKNAVRGKYFYLQPAITNKGNVWVADSEAQALAKEGLWLTPMPLTIDLDTDRGVRVDLSDIYVHGDTPGDKVVVAYLEEEDNG
jgi:hypothetical protein